MDVCLENVVKHFSNSLTHIQSTHALPRVRFFIDSVASVLGPEV
jgi:hypothetical protein